MNGSTGVLSIHTVLHMNRSVLLSFQGELPGLQLTGKESVVQVVMMNARFSRIGKQKSISGVAYRQMAKSVIVTG